MLVSRVVCDPKSSRSRRGTFQSFNSRQYVSQTSCFLVIFLSYGIFKHDLEICGRKLCRFGRGGSGDVCGAHRLPAEAGILQICTYGCWRSDSSILMWDCSRRTYSQILGAYGAWKLQNMAVVLL